METTAWEGPAAEALRKRRDLERSNLSTASDSPREADKSIPSDSQMKSMMHAFANFGNHFWSSPK